MSFFTQIIFPPKPKLVPSPPSSFEFDCWVIGSGDTKVLWVKCPECNYAYELMNIQNETALKKNLREFEPHYYRKIVNGCPNIDKHLGELCLISNK